MAMVVRPLTRLSRARLDFLLGLGIDRGSRFVEDQDARIDQQGAGDGDALALAAGQPLAAFADQSNRSRAAGAG